MEKYSTLLGLNRWLITVSFSGLEKDTAYATCEPSCVYQTAILRFDLDTMVDRNQVPTLEWTVVHELLHCRQAPLSELCSFLWEKLLEVVEEGATVDLERMPIVTDQINGGHDRPKQHHS